MIKDDPKQLVEALHLFQTLSKDTRKSSTTMNFNVDGKWCIHFKNVDSRPKVEGDTLTDALNKASNFIALTRTKNDYEFRKYSL